MRVHTALVQADERDWRGRAEGAAGQEGWQSKQPAASTTASTTASTPAGGKAGAKGDEKSDTQQRVPGTASQQPGQAPNPQVQARLFPDLTKESMLVEKV